MPTLATGLPGAAVPQGSNDPSTGAAVPAPGSHPAAHPKLWRISDRGTFLELRRHGRRARRGPLTVTWLAPPPGRDETSPRAGFTVARTAGGTVIRNRVRRRLRAALRALLAEGRLPAGTYLVGATTEVATIPWAALVDLLHDTISEAQR